MIIGIWLALLLIVTFVLDDGVFYAIAESDNAGVTINAAPSIPAVTPRSFFPETWLFDNRLSGYFCGSASYFVTHVTDWN